MTQEITVHRDVSGPLEFSTEQVQLLRDGYAPSASEVEFRTLLEVARLRRLNPFLKQIHFVKRKTREENGNWREAWTSQVSIDGLRAIAQRTGLYDGQDEPTYERTKDGLILSARVCVYRKDWSRPAVGVARWEEYVQTTRDGSPTKFWASMPHVMIGKCAEALALRKAFPEDLAGIYTDEEMDQADNSGKTDNGSSGPISSHAAPDENPHAPAKQSDTFTTLMDTLRVLDTEAFDPGCTWETMTSARSVLGRKGEPTAFSKQLSALYQSDYIAPSQKKELAALWNRVDRKLGALELKLKPPSVEASFMDAPDDYDAATGEVPPDQEPPEPTNGR